MQNKKPKPLPETGYIRLHEVLNLIPIGKSTWWAGVKDGRFPRGIKIGPNITAWHVDDIRTLIEKLKMGEVSA